MSIYGKPILLTGSSSTITPNNYTKFFQFTPESGSGGMTFVNDSNGNWRIKFTKSGTLAVSKTKNLMIDLFAVGGGGGGSQCVAQAWGGGGAMILYEGAGGGGGGYTETKKGSESVLLENTTYTITIGAGGTAGTTGDSKGGSPKIQGADGGTTYFKKGDTVIISAQGGFGAYDREGGSGGSGGGAGTFTYSIPSNSDSSSTTSQTGYRPGNGGTDGANGTSNGETKKTDYIFPGGYGQKASKSDPDRTTGEFGSASATKYGGGGGGGWGAMYSNNYQKWYFGTSYSGNENYGKGSSSSNGGGGKGAKYTNSQGSKTAPTGNAADNGIDGTGGGGGGGGYLLAAGSGGSGILIIRNKR